MSAQPAPYGATGRAGLDVAVRFGLTDLLDVPGARRVGLALAEGGGRRLWFTSSDRDADRAVDWCHIDAYDDVPLTDVVRTGEPVLAGVDDLAARYGWLAEREREAGTTALAALPLPGTGSAPMGGIVLFLAGPERVDATLGADLADRASRLADIVSGARALTTRRVAALADDPAPDGARVADTEVSGTPAAAGEARRFVRSALRGWDVPDDVVDTAVLCVSELVTNAVVHTGSPSELRVLLDGDLLTVTVRDRGAQTAVVAPAPGDRLDAMRVHGRGLQLVDALARGWASELDAVGTTVWFRLDTTA